MNVISVWIILIQIVSLGVMIVTSKDTSPKSELILTTEGMNEVGEKNNIIVFVLDKFDGSYIDEITEESPDFLLPLKDFVFYKNAVSAFCPTYNSIPFLLTGTEFEQDSRVDYVKYAYEKDNLLKQISACGYDIGVYTHKRYVDESMREIIPNYEDGIKRTCDMGALFAMMTQCSRYKMAPFAAKRYYMYDTSDIARLVENDRIVNIENDLPFYHRLIDKGLQVSADNSEGTFRFIHMHGAHPPYTMTEDFQYIEYDYRRDNDWGSSISQWKGSLKIVYEYLRQLKELGKYEDSLIIITTDHGVTSSLSDSEGKMMEVSYPILFVKEPFNNSEQMYTDTAPVCHSDMIATIRKSLGIDTLDKTLSEIDSDENRVRYMHIATPDLLEKYEISGDVSQLNSWRLIHRAQQDLESTH
ncbi:MAG: sulfatase-like hydrolase/transferase [Lachnospiraceae bacterium]|nr:sulfatase-like hydrolase/transferase [Lachnospiraceae bacterium]